MILRAFTLIEALVVVAIIAVVSAIVLPVIARGRESAKGASCLSNVSQVAKAQLLYVNEYDGRFNTSAGHGDSYHWLAATGLGRSEPSGREMPSDSKVVIPSLRCPQLASGPFDPRSPDGAFSGYAPNVCLGYEAEVEGTASVVLVADASCVRTSDPKFATCYHTLAAPDYVHYLRGSAPWSGVTPTSPIGDWGAQRHQGLGIYAMSDGRAITTHYSKFRIPRTGPICRVVPNQLWWGPSEGFRFIPQL